MPLFFVFECVRNIACDNRIAIQTYKPIKTFDMDKQNENGQIMLVGYDKHYSESGFWDKIKNVASKAGEKVVYMVLVLYYTATSKATSTEAKVMIYSAIGYFILPVDLIPDFLPVGFTDDAAALYACYKTVKSNITPEIIKQAKDKLGKWFGNTVDVDGMIE